MRNIGRRLFVYRSAGWQNITVKTMKSGSGTESSTGPPDDFVQGDTPDDLAEDREDLEGARDQVSDDRESRPWWRRLGPGLITGAADDDPSGVGTNSVTGAQFGYALLWLIPVCLPMMIAVQEMCGRVGVVTGKGLAAVIKERYSKWLLYSALALLIGANVANIYADLNIMAASAKMLFHGSFVGWLTGITLLIVVLQIFVPYRQYVRILKWLCLALAAYVIVALMPTVHNDWSRLPAALCCHPGAGSRRLFSPW